jgi:hypothetical protein
MPAFGLNPKKIRSSSRRWKRNAESRKKNASRKRNSRGNRLRLSVNSKSRRQPIGKLLQQKEDTTMVTTVIIMDMERKIPLEYTAEKI